MGEGAAGGAEKPLAPRFSPATSAPVRSGGQDDAVADAGFQPRDLAGQLVSVRAWSTCCLGNQPVLHGLSALPVIYSRKPLGDL